MMMIGEVPRLCGVICCVEATYDVDLPMNDTYLSTYLQARLRTLLPPPFHLSRRHVKSKAKSSTTAKRSEAT